MATLTDSITFMRRLAPIRDRKTQRWQEYIEF
jgi:hypothetical protein